MAKELKDKSNPWYTAMVVSAFAGIISLFHINSYVADKNNINWLFITLGIILLAGAGFCLYKANKTSTGQPG